MNNPTNPYSVRHINLSRPQLIHADSKHSISASEDFYSADDAANDSDAQSERTIKRFDTPPSRFRTPQQSYEKLGQAEAMYPSPLRPAHQRGPSGSPEYPLENKVRRKPVPQRVSTSETMRRVPPEMDSGSPTPGVDDTPYIQFALDQLTRDEEVRGSRRYRGPDEPDYPVERRVPDMGLGYVNTQITQGGPSRPPPPRPEPSRTATSPVRPDVIVPFDAPEDSFQYPRLTFLPSILRPVALNIFIFLCLLMLAGLLFCAIWSLNHDSLWEYRFFGDGRYFIFQYLPTILGMIILIWLMQIQTAVRRITPFMALASENARVRSHGPLLKMYPTQFLYPSLEHFRAGMPLLGACMIIFWLQIFTIPLLASAFNVRAFSGSWRWIAVQGVIWTVIALYILLIISLLVLAVVVWRGQTGLKWDPRSLADIIALLERSNILHAFHGSEAFEHPADFQESLAGRTDRLGYWHPRHRNTDIYYGLGENGGAQRSYSIERGRITEKTPLSMREKHGLRRAEDDLEAQSADLTSVVHDPRLRYRYLPWYLRPSLIILWILLAFFLLLAFYIISFVNSNILRGFTPLTPVAATSSGFGAANFLYSFVPSLIGLLIFLFFQPLDYAHRRHAPYAALSTLSGVDAEHSLLLDYPFRLPLVSTLTALSNGHFRIAVLSFIHITNATLPVLAGGVLWAQFYTSAQVVRISAHPSAYYALCFFLALAFVGICAAYPSKKMGLPHRSESLAEVISWIYQSRVVSDRGFRGVGTKAEMVGRLVQPSGFFSLGRYGNRSKASAVAREEAGQGLMTGEAGGRRREPVDVKYGFGVFTGRDGRQHLGIDRISRPGTEDMRIDFDQRRTSGRSEKRSTAERELRSSWLSRWSRTSDREEAH